MRALEARVQKTSAGVTSREDAESSDRNARTVPVVWNARFKQTEAKGRGCDPARADSSSQHVNLFNCKGFRRSGERETLVHREGNAAHCQVGSPTGESYG